MSKSEIVAKLIDTTTCIGCKACEVACQEWNDHSLTISDLTGISYQTQPDLGHEFWNLIKFNEIETDGEMGWNMAKYQCMHCQDPGCLAACPAPGAIFVRDNGIVDFEAANCIGCGYCMAGCPFDVPRRDPETKNVHKCTLCSDRTAVGLEPACIKVCPTRCLSFGTREELRLEADERADELRALGHSGAGVYDPPGVGGTNVFYVLKHADRPEDYGLPRNPCVPLSLRIWKGPLKWVGSLILLGGVLGTFIHYLRYGPKTVESESTPASAAKDKD